MATPEVARHFCIPFGENTFALRTGFAFLPGVDPFAVAPVVSPGMSAQDQPGTHVLPPMGQVHQRTPVVVVLAFVHRHHLPEHACGQGIARGCSTGLADFGGIQTVQPQLAVFAAFQGFDPQRVAVGQQRPDRGPAAAVRAPEDIPADLQTYLDEQERQVLLKALKECDFNRTAAANRLGLNLRQIRYRIARLNIAVPNDQDPHDDMG